MKISNFLKWMGLIYIVLCVSACSLQRKIMYSPATPIAPPLVYGLNGFQSGSLKDKDGTKIAAWYSPAHAGYPTIVFFHGNGGNLSDRTDYFRALANAGFGLLAIDYRGFGASEGSPSEEGFYQDARAALTFATEIEHLSSNRIILYGESIGTGVAVQMATEYPEGAVILQSPYTSIEALAQKRFSWLPVHYLLADRFDSLSKIEHVHAPLLLFHGENDQVVPVEEGKKLFAKANEPKQAIYYPGRGHNDLDIDSRVQALMAFCKAQKLIQP